MQQAGALVEGKISLNGEQLFRADFSKVGAYVQQDDVLIDVLTPRELLSFAVRIRLGLDKAALVQLVNNIIDKLALQDCADQRIGGWFRRGISGGERKRVSIGYELVTNPKLLLLDEPTSGLDSSSALKIASLLREEADRGVAVVATIHQPSMEALCKFDRLILLSEGHCIYQGAPELVRDYFLGLGLLGLKPHSSIADKLSAIAYHPLKVLADAHTIPALSKMAASKTIPLAPTDVDTLSSQRKTSLNSSAKSRATSFSKQVALLVKRMLLTSLREPLAFLALFCMAFFQGLL